MVDEQGYNEIREAIKQLSEVTARVDERIKMLVERFHESDEHMKTIFKSQTDVTTRIGILENHYFGNIKEDIDELKSKTKTNSTDISNIQTRLEHIERANVAIDDRWKKVFNFVYQAVSTILICWLLYRLNLSTPPLP